MPQLRIMTWNIRNLGPTKLEYDDILQAIAQVVVREQPDIFVALEINTKKETTAEIIGATLQAELQEAEAARPQNNNNNNNNQNAFPMGRKAWDTYVISPNTGLEFYGFFIRDTRVVQPVPMTSVVPNSELNAGVGSAVGNQTFTTFAGPGNRVFPLIRPNLTKQGQKKKARWTGARIPCLGLFNVTGALQPYLPILAGHFAANSAQAERQLNLLPAFDLVNDICSADPNTQARPTVDGTANYQLRHLLVTGDFNVDFDPYYYPNGVALKNQERWSSRGGNASDTESDDDDSDEEWTPSGGYDSDNNNNARDENNNNAKPKKRKLPYGALLNAAKSTVSLGLKAAVVHKTHLMKPKYFNSRKVKGTEELATNCFDNFFVSSSITVVSAGAVDVPGRFKQSDDPLHLDFSVEDYATREMKDLYWDDYEDLNVATQLMTGSNEAVSTEAALTGALLISDHLPVVMDFTIP